MFATGINEPEADSLIYLQSGEMKMRKNWRHLDGNVVHLDKSGLMKEACDSEPEYMTNRMVHALPEHRRESILVSIWEHLSLEERVRLKAAFASIESRSDHDHTDAHDSTSGSKSRRSIICDEECRGDEVGYEETIDEEVSFQSQVSSDSDPRMGAFNQKRALVVDLFHCELEVRKTNIARSLQVLLLVRV